MDDQPLSTPLGELGILDRGRSRHRPRYAHHLYGGKYPFIQTGDIKSSGGRITSFSQTYSEAGLEQSRLWDKGTLCITIAANIAETGILDFPACFPDSVVGFLANQDRCDTRYIEYTFRHLRQKIQGDASGSVQDNINLEYLRNLPVPTWSLEKQKAISHILGTLDDKIELNRKTNETLEGIAKTLFKSWFVDFDPVRAKAEGRPTGLPDEISELFPDSFEESELGEIPSGWMIESAEKHLELIKGRSYKSAELQESKTALVTLKSFKRGGGYREDGLKPYIGTFKENQVIQPGELIIALTDVTQAADVIGRPAIVRTSEGRETLVASLDVGIIREAKHGLLPQAFVYELFRTEKYVSHALSYTSGTTVLHLAKGVLADFQVVIPPMELIKTFASLSTSVLERIDISSQESRSLQKLRDALLPRLISGELRVPDAEKMLEEAGV